MVISSYNAPRENANESYSEQLGLHFNLFFKKKK